MKPPRTNASTEVRDTLAVSVTFLRLHQTDGGRNLFASRVGNFATRTPMPVKIFMRN